MSEQQRVAIVTGAAGGIGRELVLSLLGKEIKVAAVDRTAQGLAELAQTTQEQPAVISTGTSSARRSATDAAVGIGTSSPLIGRSPRVD